MTRSGQTVDKMLTQYQEAANKTRDRNPNIANEWADKLLKIYRKLRESEEGRTALTTLLSDPSPDVRGWAATHVLGWAPELGRPVLEKLRDSKGRRSFDAEIVLREFAKGKLSFD